MICAILLLLLHGIHHFSLASPVNTQLHLEDRFNYASFDCAARILSTNPGAKSAHSILSPHARDSYLRNLCAFPSKFVVIELCQDVRVDTVVLGNYEYFSSTFREVEVAVSKSYPPKGGEAGWRLLGRWEAANRREDQVFRVAPAPNAVFARYLRVRFLSHYGNEYYCPVSVIKVYGKTMIDDFEESKSKDAEEAKDSFVLVSEEEETTSKVKTTTIAEPDVCPMITFSAMPTMTPVPTIATTMTILDTDHMNATNVSSEVGLQVFKPTRPPFCPLDFFEDDFLTLAPHFVPDLGMRTRRRKRPEQKRRKKKTMIYPLVCLNQSRLEPQMCSSRVKSVVVFEEEKKADGKDEDGGDGAKENIFKAIHDRLNRLEADSQYLRDATGASLKRIESQIRRLRVEVDIGRDDDGEVEDGYAYRERLKRSLFKHLRERMGEVEAQLADDLKVLRAFEGTLFYLAILTLLNLGFMLIGLYSLYRRSSSKQEARTVAAITANVPEVGVQEVPRNPLNASEQSASSLMIGASKPVGSISLGEASMLAASPLLLFDPETDLVDRIYPGSPTQDEAGSPPPEAAASSSMEIAFPKEDGSILQ